MPTADTTVLLLLDSRILFLPSRATSCTLNVLFRVLLTSSSARLLPPGSRRSTFELSPPQLATSLPTAVTLTPTCLTTSSTTATLPQLPATPSPTVLTILVDLGASMPVLCSRRLT
ncbi:hypothetical protein FOQG_19519 [Fusarium oxysporum f. sp. raphani 54005]|uniref:Uncharacterized protein n=1 Tax=Fusarium oxysporum f. sp. raphani 54005 TaxID=1089458 RepID=X0B0V1_FUSOX|nr:hypothetical protein FOQG_19519 [Fusarium oxysporum f. sp. raphani 54005]